ncbi:MAG: MATE family efflux transporter [Acidaminococcales bacterium]|nr:MATE family efflux transporter [Acidaminococcales bacterium]
MLGKIACLTLPVVAETLATSLSGMFIIAMIGRFGAVEVAAAGLAMLLQTTVSLIVASAGTGAGALIAQAHGAGRIEDARRICGQTVGVAVCLGVAAAVFCVLGIGRIIALTVPDPPVVSLTVEFIGIAALSLPFTAAAGVCLSALRAIGETRAAMAVAVLGQAAALFLAYFMLFIARVGIHGAFSGLAAAQGLTFVLGLWAVGSKYTLTVGYRHIFALNRALLRSIVKIGAPAALEQIALQGGRICCSLIMATAGAVQFAAHNVTLQVETIAFLPGMAFGITAMTLVGNSIGGERPRRARRYAWLTCLSGACTVGAIAFFMYIFAGELTLFFIADPAVAAWGVGCVRVAALQQVALAVSLCLPGALRGAGDTKSGMYVTLISTWIFRIPLFLFLQYIGEFNVLRYWYCAFMDLTLRAVFYVFIVRKKDWGVPDGLNRRSGR